MSKSKQVTQAEEVVKQIVLTQEQFDALIKIYTALDEATDGIFDLVDSEFTCYSIRL
jgi:hypothetical protein